MVIFLILKMVSLIFLEITLLWFLSVTFYDVIFFLKLGSPQDILVASYSFSLEGWDKEGQVFILTPNLRPC